MIGDNNNYIKKQSLNPLQEHTQKQGQDAPRMSMELELDSRVEKFLVCFALVSSVLGEIDIIQILYQGS